MKKKTKLLLIGLSLLIISCSTVKRSEFYGGLAGAFLGGSVGAMIGNHLSPKGKINQQLNAALGATFGVATGGYIGAKAGRFFYGENPENRELSQMLRQETRDVSVMNLGIGDQDIKINADIVPSKKYLIPTLQIPQNIQDKMKRPVVIEHKVKEKFIQLPNNKTLYVPEFSVLEQTYEEGNNETK